MRAPAPGPFARHLDQAPLFQSSEKLTCGYLGQAGALAELGAGERAVSEEQFECRAVVQPAQQPGVPGSRLIGSLSPSRSANERFF
ncbi:hypothetical protein GCM10020001_071720 [Nonomuraea salmonea]